MPASLIYVGDTVPGERRQTEITNLMTGVALGTAVASAGAGALAQAASWRYAFVISGRLRAGALVVLLRRLPEPAANAPAGASARPGRTGAALPAARCWCCCSPSSRAASCSAR